MAPNESHSRNLIKSLIRNYLEAFAVAVVLGLVLRFIVIAPYSVPNETMTPNLQAGDFVFGFRLPFGVQLPMFEKKVGTPKTPERGDLVAFQDPRNHDYYLVKRVIGVPGDRIEIRDGRLVLNEKPLEYVSEAKPTKVDLNEPQTVREMLPGGPRYEVVLTRGAMKPLNPVVVPPGSIFVMSDRRDATDDSRALGVIPLTLVESKIFAIWMSVERSTEVGANSGFRWGRIMKPAR